MKTAIDAETILGPLEDPRYGTILEIRPTADTGRAGRYPSQAVVVTNAARRMIELSKGGQKIASIVVRQEDDDPTLHPEFREISENLRELTNKWYPRAKMVLECGPGNFRTPDERHVVVSYDRPRIRFAAGTQKSFAATSGLPGGELKRVVSDLAHIEHENFVLEAEFLRGDIDNSTDSELRAFIGHLKSIRPTTVEVSTIEKAETRGKAKVKPVTKTRLNEIVEQLAEKTGLTIETADSAS